MIRQFYEILKPHICKVNPSSKNIMSSCFPTSLLISQVFNLSVYLVSILSILFSLGPCKLLANNVNIKRCSSKPVFSFASCNRFTITTRALLCNFSCNFFLDRQQSYEKVLMFLVLKKNPTNFNNLSQKVWGIFLRWRLSLELKTKMNKSRRSLLQTKK